MDQDYLKARELFLAAVALATPEERARYLDEACRDQPGLRQRIEILLQAQTEMDDFLAPTPGRAPGEGPGTMIGHYKLLEEIGEGAFGRVFMAEQTEPVRRKVALKLIKPGMDSHEVVARFEAERQALALMDHPNIAHVLDAGATEAGRPYFVMELVRGLPITRYCDEHDLPMGERLRIFTEVCHAVQHAHQKGVIHRDLKPSNILVTEVDGEAVPKVIDFGVAKALGQQLTEKTLFTAFQQLVGTPAYMSPEQTALGGADVDTRSDVYSLGVLLYELLTGATPLDTRMLHEAGLEEMRRMIRETEPPKPSTRLHSLGEALPEVARHRHAEPSTLTRFVNGDLDWIVMKALEKDRARRYQTITALADDIDRHLASEPVSAGPPSMLYRTRKFVRRHRGPMTAAVLVLLALSAGLVVSTIMFFREHRARLATDEARAETRLALYAAHIYTARRDWENLRLDRYLHLLAQHVPKKSESDLRGWEWYYLRSLSNWHTSSARILESGANATRWNSDGTRIAAGDDTGMISVFDPEANRLDARLEGHASKVTSISWDPTSSRLASADNSGTVFVWNLGGRESVTRLKSDGIPGETIVAWNHDGRFLATGGSDGRITIWDPDTLAAQRTWKTPDPVIGLDWHPSDSRLAAAHDTSFTATVWDAASATLLFEQESYRRKETTVRWSPDGRFLATCGWNISVFDTSTWEKCFHHHPQSLQYAVKRHALAWSPDSRLLVSIHHDRSIRFWDIEGRASVFNMLAAGSSFSSVDWNGKQNTIVTGCQSGSVKFWDGSRLQEATIAFEPSGPFSGGISWSMNEPRLLLRDGIRGFSVWTPGSNDLLRIAEQSGSFSAAIWNPVGDKFAAINTEGVVFCWSGHSGKLAWKIETSPPKSGTGRVSWTSDGRWIAATNGKNVAVLDALSGERSSEIDVGDVTRLAWSPNGKFLATSSPGGEVRLWSPEGHLLNVVLKEDASNRGLRSLDWSPDSQHLMVVRSYGRTPLLAEIGEAADEIGVSSLPLNLIGSFAWHPDGKRIAIGDSHGLIRIADPDTGAELMTIRASEIGIGMVDWSPDGKRLVSGAGGVFKVWDATEGYELGDSPCEFTPLLDDPGRVIKGVASGPEESPERQQ